MGIPVKIGLYSVILRVCSLLFLLKSNIEPKLIQLNSQVEFVLLFYFCLHVLSTKLMIACTSTDDQVGSGQLKVSNGNQGTLLSASGTDAMVTFAEESIIVTGRSPH